MKNLILLILLSLCSQFNFIQATRSTNTEAFCHPDFDALIAIYNATNGANWNSNNGWIDGAADSNCEPCTWEGITCVNNRVTRIILINNNLTGTIPAEIGDFEHLIELDFRSNPITGNIPTEIGNLLNLQKLFLFNSQLDGTIPMSIGNLTQLTTINLGTNNLTGEIPAIFGDLTALTLLNLGANDFTGGIPTELENLINLEFLDLQFCGLTGVLPEGLGNLSLTTIRLNNNQLEGCYPSTYSSFCPLSPVNRNFGNNMGLPSGGNDFESFCSNNVGECITLPLQLTHFSGKAQDNKNLLQWTTASEKDIAYFQIERSDNGQSDWEILDKVFSKGDLNSTHHHEAIDFRLYSKTYYRLRIVEHSDKEYFSEVIFIERPQDLAWEIVPNPAQDNFQITLDLKQQETAQISIRDLLGRLIWHSKINSETTKINCQDWSAGIYLIQLQKNGQSFIQKLVVE